jgi:hypothetical protein
MARRYRVLVVARPARRGRAKPPVETTQSMTRRRHCAQRWQFIYSVVTVRSHQSSKQTAVDLGPQLSTVRTAARMNCSDHGGPHTGQTGHNHSTPPSRDCNPGRTLPHTGANPFHGSQARFRHDWGMPCSVDNERVIRLSYNGYITGRSCFTQVWTILETATWQSICARFENALRSDDVLG